MNIACYDCHFWSPGEGGSFHEESRERPKEWESESLPGECRRQPPSLGELICDTHDDEFRFFGQWPRTMACDWCGCLEPRLQTPLDPPKTPEERPREAP